MKTYYWLAMNGASCAMSSIPMPPTLKVTPAPEQLFGFPTVEEARDVQQYCLTAPIKDVARRLNSLLPRIKCGDIIYMRPANPQPPTHGVTQWLDESGKTA